MAIHQIFGPDSDSYKNPSKKMVDSRGFQILIFGGFRIWILDSSNILKGFKNRTIFKKIIYIMMIIFRKRELKEKIQDANLSLPIKNPNPLLKNGFRIWIPKLGGFRIQDSDCQP